MDNSDLNELLDRLKDGKHDKIYHAILNGFAPLVPFLPAISAYTSAATQEQKDAALAELLKYQDDRIDIIDTAIVQLDTSRRVIQRQLIELDKKVPVHHEICFNHRTLEWLQGDSLSGITDNGTNDFTLNTLQLSGNIIVSGTSSSKISYNAHEHGIDIKLEEGCPDVISLSYTLSPKRDV